MTTHPICDDPGATNYGDHGKVTWGHMRSQFVFFFANNSRQDGDRDAQMMPNDFARQTVSEDMHIGLQGPWPTLTWPDLRSDFEIDLSGPISTWSKLARRGEHDGVIFSFIFLIKKKNQWKAIHAKNDDFFSWWPLEAPKLLTLGQMWS